MQVTVEVLPGLERKMTVNVPSEGVQSEVEKRLKDMLPRVAIAGFRKGKVPFNVVRQHYEDSVRREVISEVIGSTYQAALEQEKLMPVGLPNVHLSTTPPGQALQYEAKFEVFPKIELKSLEGVELETIKLTVGEQDIDKLLEKLRKQQSKWVEVNRPAQLGDRVKLDFDGQINGESFEGGTRKDVTIELGSGQALPDFEKGLIGATKGQELSLNVQFPATYPQKELAEKHSVVAVKIYEVLAAELPELDAEFAKKLGVEEGGIEKLRIEVKENLTRELQQKIDDQLKANVLEKLLARNPVELPQVLIEEEIKKLQQQTQQMAAQRQGSAAPMPPREQFIAIATQRVGLGLLFGEFIRQHHLKADPQQVEERLAQIAAPYGDPAAIIAWYRGNKEQLAVIESAVIEDQIVAKLLTEVTLKEKPQTYLELLAENSQQEV